MSWFDTEGKMSENILFSKVTYRRNISGEGFPHKNSGMMSEIISRTESILKKNGFHSEDISKRGRYTSLSYFEKQYTDESFCNFRHSKAIFLNEPCSLSICVGGADLFNIYAILPGASVSEAYKISSSAEELLDSEFDFAFDEQIGYLSPLFDACGSGVRISSAMYLPLLSQSKKLFEIEKRLSEQGISIYPLFSHAHESHIYVMTYSPSYPCCEGSCVSMFEKIMCDIINLEMSEVSSLDKSDILNIEDDGCTALGSLAFSFSLSEKKLIEYIEKLRLCISVGCDKKTGRNISPSMLNSILFDNLSYSILSSTGAKISSDEALCFERAQQVKRALALIPEAGMISNT